jgi:uncharacterized membrane protein
MSLRRLLPLLVFLLAVAAVAEACPNCKDTLAGDPAQQGLVKGLYYSILFMISMPFFIFGGLCSYFYYLVRCDRAKKAKAAAAELPADSVQAPAAG